MTKRIAFEKGATITVAGQAPQSVDVIIHVPGRPDKLLAFTERHPDARIVGYTGGDVAA